MKERRNACALQSAKELEQLYPQFTTDLAWETTKASGVLFKSGEQGFMHQGLDP